MTTMRAERIPTALSTAVAAALVALAVTASGLSAPAGAQALQGLRGGDQPLEITADEGIEWRRNEQLYIARGNAWAKRGDVEIFSEVMSAHYAKTPGGDTDIDRIDVEGNVRIMTPTETVYGDRGAYDVVNGILVLVGENLRLVGQNGRITARDSLEYWEKKNMAVARGDAVAVREDNEIRADVLTAHFREGSDGGLELERVEGHGNVEVTSPTEYARGDRGTYFIGREFATLTGDVRITREENQLNGQYAEVDMKTGVSRLLAAPPGAAPSGSTRVEGLLVPRRKPTEGQAP